MLVAIAAVTGLAWWDDQREAGAALRDLQSEQSILASSIAGTLRAHLAAIEGEGVLIGEDGSGRVGSRYAPVVVRSASEPRTTSPDPDRLDAQGAHCAMVAWSISARGRPTSSIATSDSCARAS